MATSTKTRDLLTRAQAAAAIGRTTRTIDRLRTVGLVKFIRGDDGRIYLRRAEVEKLKEAIRKLHRVP